jgi:uncharacterized protein YhhL (DUF1145 family)
MVFFNSVDCEHLGSISNSTTSVSTDRMVFLNVLSVFRIELHSIQCNLLQSSEDERQIKQVSKLSYEV